VPRVPGTRYVTTTSRSIGRVRIGVLASRSGRIIMAAGFPTDRARVKSAMRIRPADAGWAHIRAFGASVG
jgi:hypothetical protein